MLWQFVEPCILEILRIFKTGKFFWKKAQSIFANDNRRLNASTHKLVSLKRIDHMKFFIFEGQSVIEELKMLLETNSREEIKENIDKLYMVMILCAMNPNFDHIWDQMLTGQEAPSMESLTTQLYVPTLKGRNLQESTKASATVSTCGRIGQSNRGGCGG